MERSVYIIKGGLAMDEVEEALNHIFSDTPPDGVFRTESLEMHKELQHRKKLRDKKHRQDYRFFKRDMIRKSTKGKRVI